MYIRVHRPICHVSNQNEALLQCVTIARTLSIKCSLLFDSLKLFPLRAGVQIESILNYTRHTLLLFSLSFYDPRKFVHDNEYEFRFSSNDLFSNSGIFPWMNPYSVIVRHGISSINSFYPSLRCQFFSHSLKMVLTKRSETLTWRW